MPSWSSIAHLNLRVALFKMYSGCSKMPAKNALINSADPDQTVFPVCYSDKQSVYFSTDNQYFILRTEREKCSKF